MYNPRRFGMEAAAIFSVEVLPVPAPASMTTFEPVAQASMMSRCSLVGAGPAGCGCGRADNGTGSGTSNKPVCSRSEVVRLRTVTRHLRR